MEGRSKVNEHEGLMRLSDHTIHVMTVALTEINVTAGVRPNCEENWRITTNSVNFKVPWPRVWRKPTLPLADATESRAREHGLNCFTGNGEPITGLMHGRQNRRHAD